MKTLAEICDRIAATLPSEPYVLRRADIDLIVIAAVREIGLDVNTKTGEVYNPAHEGKTLFPEQKNPRYAGMPSRRKMKR